MRAERVNIGHMLTIWRRHTKSCPYRTRGRNVLKCNCPLWADGYVGGKRVLRQSLGTRDMARARKKAVALESPDNRTGNPSPTPSRRFSIIAIARACGFRPSANIATA